VIVVLQKTVTPIAWAIVFFSYPVIDRASGAGASFETYVRGAAAEHLSGSTPPMPADVGRDNWEARCYNTEKLGF
jgi:hypothetical protein